MEIKGTYHCQTTQHPNTLNSWDIRSVSVELPEQDKLLPTSSRQPAPPVTDKDGFMSIPDGSEEEIPF